MRFKLILLIYFLYPLSHSLFAYRLSDSATVIKLNQECFDLVYNQTDIAKQKGFLALKIAQSIHYSAGEAQAFSRLGIVYDVEGKFDSALLLYNKSYQVNRQIRNKKGQGASLCNIGLLHFNRNNYTEALNNLHAAITPLEDVNAYQYLGNCYNNIGLLYHELDQYDRAAYYYKQAILNYEIVKNTSQKANAIANLASLFSDLNKYDSAIILENQSITIYIENNDYYNLGKSYNNIAESYSSLGLPVQAESSYLLSIINASKAQNNIGLAGTYINLGMIYYNSHREKKGIRFIKQAYDICQHLETPKLKSEVYYHYGNVLVKEGKYKLASKLFKESFQLKDSIFKYETAEKIASQATKFGIERKENENKLLKQTNRIQELELANKKIESQKINTQMIGISVLSFMILIFTFIYFKRRYKEQSYIDESRHQNEKHRQRINISHELHDNVGAQLSYIVSNLGLLETTEIEKSRIQAISDMSKLAIITLRETVWALNTESIYLTGFSDKFKHYISKTLEFNKNLTYKFEESIYDDFILKPLQALNLFRICQEILSNAIRHSQCKNIEIRLVSKKSTFNIIIHDDGIGFKEGENSKTGHYGIQNMKGRAKEIGAILLFNSQSNNGTLIRIEINENTTYV